MRGEAAGNSLVPANLSIWMVKRMQLPKQFWIVVWVTTVLWVLTRAPVISFIETLTTIAVSDKLISRIEAIRWCLAVYGMAVLGMAVLANYMRK